MTAQVPSIVAQRRPAAPSGPRIGWLRPVPPGRDIPLPESTARRWAIRSVAIVALLTTCLYLGWRILFTVDPVAWWVSIPLLVLEFHAALGLALFTFSLWDVDAARPARDVTVTDERVAVLIPTYNEGIEILMPTIAAALAMRVDHETWVLDDGNRPEVATLARDLGAHYIARPEHSHAKAGNLNHALGVIEADLIAVLDADHVAAPDFLVHTLGYFDDPKVAVVQTPQEFYNTDSFEHATGGEGERYHEQVLFYRILQPAKNRWKAAFWCGTGAVVRVAALRDVGGVATDTITEDIHTTIRLHRRGWRSVYHNEVLARGLAAGDADTYQLQRNRWGTGAMQVLRNENPLWVSGLTIQQRLAYAATLLGWFDAWRSLGYLLLPIAVVVTGAVPIRAEPLTFALAFSTTFILQQLAMRVLSRGCHRPILSILFELVRMTPNLLATLTLLPTRRRITFKVTPKGRQDDGTGRRKVHVPQPLLWLAALSVFASAWFTATVMGATPVTYEVPWAAYAAFGWLVVNVGLVFLAIRRIRASRYAPERRASVRFATDMAASIDGAPCTVTDLSLTGARLVVPAAIDGGLSRTITLSFGGEKIALGGVVRSVIGRGDGSIVCGFEFVPGQHRACARLALGLFATRVAPRAEDQAVAREAIAA